MSSENISDHRAYGAAVLKRFAELTVPPIVKPALAAFKARHGAYEAASSR